MTHADLQLQAALAARGLEASPDKFKRWRAHGLLDSPPRPGRGRGRGRPSERYPEHAIDQAATIIELLDHKVPLDEMAVAMFLFGAPVSVSAIRDALQTLIDRHDFGVNFDER